MKVSLNWLRDYVDITLPTKELAHRLTMSGTEVSGIEIIGGGWDNIVVGEVIEVKPHPNADRLRLATVNLGTESPTSVCGAPNLALGQKVAFARIGAELIDGHSGERIKLSPSRIRGVLSEGMICSEKELGISNNHSEIMVLPDDAPIETPIGDYLGDVIFDLDITPNRPDCLSLVGIAREVGALTGQRVHLPEDDYPEVGPPVDELASVHIADPDLCSRYCASLLTDVRVAQSPRWIQERLIACGMRPINNIVDVTNYVMLEYGQPLHAFDYQKIRGGRIVVRRAGDGEVLTTLDEVERTLNPQTLVIADEEGPIAIAGVMGGLGSEVRGETTSILIESANFNNVSIRRTSSGLHLRSEASSRFEKGMNPDLTILALRRATQLILKLTNGKAAKGIINVHPVKREREAISLSTSEVERILGMDVGIDKVRELLGSLGFECKEKAPSELMVSVPYWRTDIHLADDLVEEVARIIGYDEIPITMLHGEIPTYEPEPIIPLRERVRDILAGYGLQEVITYSLVSLGMLERAHSSGAVRVANPMTSEQEYLRTTLRPGLLKALSSNEKHEDGAIWLFEVGRTYLPREGDLPEEREMVCGIISGPRIAPLWPGGGGNFFDAKGVVETLFARLGIEVRFEACEDEVLSPGRTAGIFAGEKRVGVLGEVHPRVSESFDISRPAFLFELDLGDIAPYTSAVRRYSPLPRFPTSVRDIALVIDEGLPSIRVKGIIEGSPLVSQATLFDIYSGEQVPGGKKSLAYRIIYQSPSRTLTDEEVNQEQERILGRLHRELGATLRR